jgi:phospholipase/carboxylesterase
MHGISTSRSWQSFDRAVSQGLGGGRTSGHAFYTPIHYTKNYQYPLVVYLHGPGNNEREVGQVFRHVSTRNFLAVGVGGNRAVDNAGVRFDWNDSPSAIARSEESIVKAIEAAKSRFNVHPNRIVLVGYRTGGTMALRQAMMSPDRFAAVVSIGGVMPKMQLANFDSLRLRRLPMLWQWGMSNPQFGDDQMRSDLKSAMMISARVEVRQYPTEDEMDTVVLSQLNQWLMNTVVSGTVGTKSWESRRVEYSSN